MSKVNPFLALTTPFWLIFLSSLSNTDKVALVANLGKIFIVKKTARSIFVFSHKVTITLPRNPPD